MARHYTYATELAISAADEGLTGLIFCNCERDLRRLAYEVGAYGESPAMSMRLLSAVRRSLSRLPAALRSEFVGSATSFCRANLSVRAIARSAGCSPRSVARWFRAAGFEEPRKTFAALRLLRLWPAVRRRALPTAMLANEAGYESEHTMRAHCKRFLGASPAYLRRMHADTEMLHALTAAVLRADATETETTDALLSAANGALELGRRRAVVHVAALMTKGERTRIP